MKRDKNIIIGVLCGMLVLMGAGYAFFTAQLNIASTGTIKGNFKVVMTEVTPTAVCPSETSQITSACGTADGTLNSGIFVYNPGVTTVTLDTSLMKPNDVVVYTIKVENQGNIAARYKEINNYASDAHVEIETDIDDTTNAPIDIIQPGGSDTFTVTVRLKNLNNTEFNASKAPTTHSWTLSPVFEQVTSGGETPSVDPTPSDDDEPVLYHTSTTDQCFISFIQGEINYYDSSCGASVEIPSNLGSKVSELTGYTFNSTLCAQFAPVLKGTVGYGSASDEQFCSALQNNIANLYNTSQEALYSSYYSAFVIPTYTTPQGGEDSYNLVTKVGAGSFAAKNITSLSISSNITEIKDAAFVADQISTVNIPNSVTSIGQLAFTRGAISTLTVGTGLTRIGNSAFSNNSINSLDFRNSTALTSVGEHAFEGNQIATLYLPPNISTIGGEAFESNRLSTIVIPSSLTDAGRNSFDFQKDSNNNPTLTSITIKMSESDWNNVSNSSNCFDMSLSPTIDYVP